MSTAIANITNKIYRTAIYIRLSKEDDKIGESESITNQRSLLIKYVEENDYELVDIYIDDGYSGTNFNRPEFKRMLEDIEEGKINMVITKEAYVKLKLKISEDFFHEERATQFWLSKIKSVQPI